MIRKVSTLKSRIDQKISKQRGTFSNRSPKELKEVFGLEFSNNKNIKELNLGESRLDKLNEASQTFMVAALSRYSSTFPESQSMKKNFDGFQGNERNMCSHIEFFIRSVVMGKYESGVSVSSDESFFDEKGEYKGNSDLKIYSEDKAAVICRFAKFNEKRNTYPLELGFCINAFEVYAEYCKNPGSPVYGCVSDLNNWLFLMYDGTQFYKTYRVYKLALHNTAILSLAIKFLNILDKDKSR